jgi:glucose uptake protein GlcU
MITSIMIAIMWLISGILMLATYKQNRKNLTLCCGVVELAIAAVYAWQVFIK